jgi:hypothetical protein
MTSTWAGPLAGYCADQRVRPGVTVVFVTGNYGDVFRSWCCQPGAPRKEEILLVACDRAAKDTWGREGMTVLAAPTDGSLGGLWQTRLDVFAALCRAGVDFFHSDADAFWRRDPRDYCRALQADLVFSQGTIHPRAAVRAWGFVLCCGFFSVRANQATASFLEGVNRHCSAITKPDDQVALNTLLLEQDTAWDANRQVADRRDFRGEELRFFPGPVHGQCQAAGLDVCLLPHHLFPRLGPPIEEVMVEHLLENKKRSEE